MNTYANQNELGEGNGLGQDVSRLSVATLVPLAGLFFLRLILASLPVIKRAAALGDTGLTPLLMIKAALDTVSYFLVIRFCFAVSERMKQRRPHLAELATVILLAGCALVATLSYTGYENLAAALMPAEMDVYNWVFLAVVLAPIGMIVVLVSRRLDFFAGLMQGKVEAQFSKPEFAQAAAVGRQAPPSAPPPARTPSPEAEAAALSVEAAKERVIRARAIAARLRGSGPLAGDLAESVDKMEGYLEGAVRSIAGRDWAGAKGFADWAEYEASRVAPE